jgi:hypothetical protein
MWRRDCVFWGKGSDKGILQGRRSGKIIDFLEPIGVYILNEEPRQPI